MITDSGAEQLLTAIYQQARADVEDVFARVVLLRKSCERGRLPGYMATVRVPLVTEEEQTALWWFAGRRWLPKEMAAMMAAIEDYRRHCLHCCRKAGGGEDG